MWETIKDYALAAFYVASAFILVVLVFMMGLLVMIPVLIYGTYKVLQIRREIKEHEHVQIYYTKPDRDRPGTHEDQ